MSELVIRGHIIDDPIEHILQEVKKELTNGKLKSLKLKGGEVQVTCPHHGNGVEQNPDCYIVNSKEDNLEYGYCHCFACGFSGRLSKFIGECFDADEQYGENWLLKRYGNLYFENNLDLKAFDFNEVVVQKDYLDESVLDSMQSYHPYMDKRKLSKEVCNTFKIKYEPQTGSLVFPVYDEDNKLYMLTRRSVDTKKFIIPPDKEKPVYLLNYIKEKNIQEVIVCESQINALYLWSLGYSAIALFGTGTMHQYDILNNTNIKHYYLCFDGDSAGNKGIKRFIKNIRKDVFVDVIVMPVGKDANDLTLEEFENLEILDSFDWRNKYESEL